MFRLIIYDIKSQLRENKVKIVVFAVICVLISILCAKQMEGKRATVLDYICFMVGGPKHIPPGMLEIYNFPILWLSLQVMIAYTVGYYAVTDLHTFGQQILIRSGERKNWWISKCVCNFTTVLSMYFILYGIIVAIAIHNGALFTMKLTPEISTTICNLQILKNTTGEVLIILLFMPLLVSCAISMAQMVLSFIASPIIAFLFSQSIVFLSTIYEYKFLILNYSMLSHNRITCMSDIKCSEGIIICTIVWITSFILGMIYFGRCDIIPKKFAD